VALVLTVVAAIDAALEEAWDLVTVLVVVALLVAALTLRICVGRQAVRLPGAALQPSVAGSLTSSPKRVSTT
jgi:hypothetical protein